MDWAYLKASPLSYLGFKFNPINKWAELGLSGRKPGSNILTLS